MGKGVDFIDQGAYLLFVHGVSFHQGAGVL